MVVYLLNIINTYNTVISEIANRSGNVSPILFFILYVLFIKVVFMISKKILLRIASRTKNKVDDKIITALYYPLYSFAIIVGLYGLVRAYISADKYVSILNKLLLSASFLIFGIVVYRVINIFIHEYGRKLAKKTKSDIDDNLLPFVESLIKVSVLVIVLLQILGVWDIEITPLLASAGVAGVAIALAAQETIKNLFGGVTLYIDKNLKIGDIVIVDGKKLEVLEVGVRSTKFLTLDNTLLIIPNSHLASTSIENLSAPYDKTKKVKITFGVAYGSDVEKVKKVAIETANKHKNVIKEHTSVWFTEMKDYYLEFLLIAHVDDASKVFSTKCEITEMLYDALNREGISIPFPTYTIEKK